MRRSFWLLLCLTLVLCSACSIVIHDETPPPDPGPSDVSTISAPSGVGESVPPDPSLATEPYTKNGFAVTEASFDAPISFVPEEEFLLITNNVLQDAAVFSEDRDDILAVALSYSADAPISGAIRFVLLHEGESIRVRTYAPLEFAAAGENTLTLSIKTGGKLSGVYTLQWYIDDMLAYEGTTHK